MGACVLSPMFESKRRQYKTIYVAETECSKTEDDVLWPCDASKRYGKGYDAGMRRGKKEEADGRNTHDSGMNLAKPRHAV